MPLPYPDIPDLQPQNWIDLELLGPRDLQTYVKYPGLGAGSRFWPNWRGCGAMGEVVDVADSMHVVFVDPGPKGELITIANSLLIQLDQGWVFYSYRLPDLSNPDLPGEESLRHFFYVGKRDWPVSEAGLGVVQFKESHELRIALDMITGQATLVTPAYRAMSINDRVTLKLERYRGQDDYLDTLEQGKILTAQDLGQPLEWRVSKNQLDAISNGFVDASYSLVYATPTIETASPVQRLQVQASVTGLLPALTIKDFNDSALDPEDFPEGAILQVPLYPGILAGDVVVLYADSASHLIKTQRVDPSTLDSQVLTFMLEYAWLAANTGQQLTLAYEYARLAAAGRSVDLTVMLSQPLDLPPPIVEGAIPEGSSTDRGYLNASAATAGVYVRVPDTVIIGAGDQVQMHWQGHAGTGSIIVTTPESGNARRFFIPPSAVPANMGKRVDVFYQILIKDQGTFKSCVFDLEIRRINSGWPVIQLTEPPGGSPLSLARVASTGAVLTLQSWVFMAAGQWVNIRVTGLNPAGAATDFNVRAGNAEPVTDSEYASRQLRALLPRAGLQALKLDTRFNIHVKVSFDKGASYVSFPDASILLIA